MTTAAQPEFYVRAPFAVADVATSVAYYRDKLGFAQHWDHRDTPEEPIIIAQVGRNGLDLILDGGTAMSRPGGPSVLFLSLHGADQLAALYRELQERGATLAGPPKPAYWQPGIWVFEAQEPRRQHPDLYG